MAPEVHSGSEEATRASDVFSFHVVMWEVSTVGGGSGARLVFSFIHMMYTAYTLVRVCFSAGLALPRGVAARR